jgi:hypothetical protein
MAVSVWPLELETFFSGDILKQHSCNSFDMFLKDFITNSLDSLGS